MYEKWFRKKGAELTVKEEKKRHKKSQLTQRKSTKCV